MIQGLRQDDGPWLLLHILLPMFMTLFFFESLRVFIGLIYFVNLGAMTIGVSVLYIFLLLSPIVVLFIKKIGAYRIVIFSAVGIVIFRLLMALLSWNMSLMLITSGIATMLYGIFVASIIITPLQNTPERLPGRTGSISISFALALAMDIMFRAIGGTWDITIGSYSIAIVIPLTIITFIIIWLIGPVCGAVIQNSSSTPKAKKSRLVRMFMGAGFGGGLFMIYTLLGFPNVVARWTNTSYEFNTVSVVIALLLYAILVQIPKANNLVFRREIILVLNLLLIVAVMDIIYIHSVIVSVFTGIAVFAMMADLSVLWGIVVSRGGDIVDSGLFHFFGMFLFMFLILFFALSFVAGMILPALEGMIPYLLMLATFLVFIVSVGVSVSGFVREVEE